MKNLFVGDKVHLVNEFDKLKEVGKTYEIADIRGGNIIVRDDKTKVAVASIDLISFNNNFKKIEEIENEWTSWYKIVDPLGDTFAFYRTNYKKVQVKLFDGIKSEASCNVKYNDKFDLEFGIRLAYCRCMEKLYKETIEEHEAELEEINNEVEELKHDLKNLNSSLATVRNRMKVMICSLTDPTKK